MPARPISDETLQLIDAVRTALEACSDVEEKRMFGFHVFMVNGKMCVGVNHEELFVRLPPATHAEVAETPGVRPLSSKGLMDGYFLISPAAFATRAQWQHWIDAALAYNPQAKASPKKAAKPRAAAAGAPADAAPRRAAKRSSASQAGMPQAAPTPAKQPATPPAPARKHSVFDDDDEGL